LDSTQLANARKRIMTLCQTFLIGLGLLTSSALSTLNDSSSTLSVPEIKEPQACCVTLTWTTDTQGWTGGDWDGGVQAAANFTGDGFTDWRLPTVQELQNALQIPNGQPGSWGLDLRNPGGSGRGWTSQSSGKSAYAVTIVKDANGAVIQSQSGQSTKYLKTSNFSSTKFVRP
jgi:hypothetical protein